MRRLLGLIVVGVGLATAVGWWRRHPRTGAGLMNRIVNPWLEGRGVIGGSRVELALIEHIGRRSGTARRTPIHPMPTADGYRIIVPIGERSQWARNVLAAGHCRMIIGDRVIELDEPVLETPRQVPDLAPPARAAFEWLGFRYLRLRRLDAIETPPGDVVVDPAAARTVSVPA